MAVPLRVSLEGAGLVGKVTAKVEYTGRDRGYQSQGHINFCRAPSDAILHLGFENLKSMYNRARQKNASRMIIR